MWNITSFIKILSEYMQGGKKPNVTLLELMGGLDSTLYPKAKDSNGEDIDGNKYFPNHKDSYSRWLNDGKIPSAYSKYINTQNLLEKLTEKNSYFYPEIKTYIRSEIITALINAVEASSSYDEDLEEIISIYTNAKEKGTDRVQAKITFLTSLFCESLKRSMRKREPIANNNNSSQPNNIKTTQPASQIINYNSDIKNFINVLYSCASLLEDERPQLYYFEVLSKKLHQNLVLYLTATERQSELFDFPQITSTLTTWDNYEPPISSLIPITFHYGFDFKQLIDDSLIILCRSFNKEQLVSKLKDFFSKNTTDNIVFKDFLQRIESLSKEEIIAYSFCTVLKLQRKNYSYD